MASPETVQLFEQQCRQRAAMLTAGVLASERYLQVSPELRTGKPESDPEFQQAVHELLLAEQAVNCRDYKVND